MSEFYLPRDKDTSCVVIELRAAGVVGELLVKALQQTSHLQVIGRRIVQRDRYTINAVTGMHQLNDDRPYKVVDVNEEVEHMVSSLRWHEAAENLPMGLEEGFPYLCVYEIPYDRYIDVIALSSFGFEACTADGETLCS